MIKKGLTLFIVIFVITYALLYFINYKAINNANEKNSNSYLLKDLKEEYKDYFDLADKVFFKDNNRVYLEYRGLSPEEIMALNVIVYAPSINDETIQREINRYLSAKGESNNNYITYKNKVSEKINSILEKYEPKRKQYLRKPYINFALSSFFISFFLTFAYVHTKKSKLK